MRNSLEMASMGLLNVSGNGGGDTGVFVISNIEHASVAGTIELQYNEHDVVLSSEPATVTLEESSLDIVLQDGDEISV